MRKLARRVISLRYHSGIYNRIYISFQLDFKNEYTKNNIFNIFSAIKRAQGFIHPKRITVFLN